MKLERLFDILAFQNTKYPNAKALVNLVEEQWKAYTIQECQQKVDDWSTALLAIGLKQSDFLLMMPSLATAEWILLDLAAQQIGVVVVPIHASFKKEQIQYIVAETKASFCFVKNEVAKTAFLNNINAPDCLVFTPEKLDNDAYEAPSNVYKSTLDEIKASIKASDLATIIYTSGTTGMPKGVMLTHANLVSNLHAMMPLLPVSPDKIAISFLPYSHIFERSAIFTYIAMGCSVHLIGERDHMLKAFKDIRPHFFTAVPRILESIHEGVLAFQAKQNILVKKMIHWALKVGMEYQEQPGFRPIYAAKRSLAKLIAFNKLNRILGGRVEAVIVGAAHLQPTLGRLLAAAGIQIREGYGMTETSPAISFNRFTPGLNAFGTVGLPVPGVQVKIQEPDENGEGEIWVKGDNVMKGYYQKPVETKAVLTEDGWFKTGDIGQFVQKRFLKITDRKKDIFKTSSGKYVAPQVIEQHFSSHPLIDQIIVIGFQKPYVAALIKPNFTLLEQWAKEQKIHWTSPQYMVINIKIRQYLERVVEDLNEALSSHQKVRKFHLFYKEWTIEEGHLSYTMKLIRPTILDRYEKEITGLY